MAGVWARTAAVEVSPVNDRDHTNPPDAVVVLTLREHYRFRLTPDEAAGLAAALGANLAEARRAAGKAVRA